MSSTCNYTSDGSSSIKSVDKQSLLSLFSSDCNGRQSCNFNLSKITFTDSNCPSTSTYYIRGDCKSSSALGLYKSSISIIVVCCDLGVSYLIWILLQIHSRFEKLEDKEIEESTLTGTDFTV